jgi:hypothetical protein
MRKQMDVGLNHPDLENVGPFFPGNGSQESTKETGNSRIDERFSISSRPDQMEVEAMVHR